MRALGWLEHHQGNVVAARRWYQGAVESGHVDHAPRAMADLGTLEAQQAKHS
jgi:hypothetical protein